MCKLPLRKRKQRLKTLLEVPRQLVICACVSRILFGCVQVLIIKTWWINRQKLTEICSEGGSDPTRTVRYVTLLYLKMQSFKKQFGVFPGEYLLVDDFSLKGNFLRQCIQKKNILLKRWNNNFILLRGVSCCLSVYCSVVISDQSGHRTCSRSTWKNISVSHAAVLTIATSLWTTFWR